MIFVNRCAVVLTPKIPFLNWVNSVTPEHPVKMDEFDDFTSFYLIAEIDSNEEALEYIEDNFSVFFRAELMLWYEDESAWPGNMDWNMFKQGFSIRFASVVIDAGFYNLA
jgi:hypothetical protein